MIARQIALSRRRQSVTRRRSLVRGSTLSVVVHLAEPLDVDEAGQEGPDVLPLAS
jgi:hypothetical protein